MTAPGQGAQPFRGPHDGGIDVIRVRWLDHRRFKINANGGDGQDKWACPAG
jgi:hypothetical protein